MKKIISIKLNKEFKRAYYRGKFKANPFLVTYMVKNRLPFPRVGITTSKKIGCAVKRNRARRIIRQAFYELEKESVISLKGYDFVFVARNLTTASTTKQIKEIMKKQISFLLKK